MLPHYLAKSDVRVLVYLEENANENAWIEHTLICEHSHTHTQL